MPFIPVVVLFGVVGVVEPWGAVLEPRVLYRV